MSSSQEGNKLIIESYFFHVTVIISKKEEKLCSSEHSLNQTVKINVLFFFFLQFRASFQTVLYLSNFFFFSSCLVFECHGFLFTFFSVAIWSISCVCQSPLTILRGPQERSFVSRLLIKKVIVRFIVIGRQKVKLAGAFQFTFTGSLGMYEQQVKKAEILSLQQPA